MSSRHSSRSLVGIEVHVFKTDLDELKAHGYTGTSPTVRRLLRRLADELRQQRGEQPHGDWRMLAKDLEGTNDG